MRSCGSTNSCSRPVWWAFVSSGRAGPVRRTAAGRWAAGSGIAPCDAASGAPLVTDMCSERAGTRVGPVEQPCVRATVAADRIGQGETTRPGPDRMRTPTRRRPRAGGEQGFRAPETRSPLRTRLLRAASWYGGVPPCAAGRGWRRAAGRTTGPPASALLARPLLQAGPPPCGSRRSPGQRATSPWVRTLFVLPAPVPGCTLGTLTTMCTRLSPSSD